MPLPGKCGVRESREPKAGLIFLDYSCFGIIPPANELRATAENPLKWVGTICPQRPRKKRVANPPIPP